MEVVPLHARQKELAADPLRTRARRSRGGSAGRASPAGEAGDLKDRQIARLKQELSDAKQRFLAVIEEHQISREESQNTTEEALSTNEELQSLNEELETAKEELQSTNEELITVNDELQAKNVALAKARDFAMSIVETVRQPLLVLDMELRIKMANRAFYRLFQVSPLEAEGRLLFSLSDGPWEIPALREELEVLVHGGVSFPSVEIERDFPGVGHKFLVVGGSRIEHLKMILLSVEDVSERKRSAEALRRSEDHLRQAQKMEAIGRLAGGIAHDFNNLLTAIIGYSALLLDNLAGNEEARQQVQEIKSAGDRAASLTRQLLAFSRRQVLQPKVIDLNLIVADFDRMLRRTGGRTDRCGHRLRTRSLAGAGRPRRNRPRRHESRAECARRHAGRRYADHSNRQPDAGGVRSARARLAARPPRDAGSPRHRRGHGCRTCRSTSSSLSSPPRKPAREPALVWPRSWGSWSKAAAPSGASPSWDWAPLSGSSCRRWPRPSNQPPASPAGLITAPSGTETILLVEDEETVRVLVGRILKARGYTVLEARNGRDGLKLCETHPGKIDLLLTDVVMPVLGGRELAEAALKLRPGLKVMFMSGHTQDVMLKEGVQHGAAFLHKPFTPLQLAQKVRETLDSEVAYVAQAAPPEHSRLTPVPSPG